MVATDLIWHGGRPGGVAVLHPRAFGDDELVASLVNHHRAHLALVALLAQAPVLHRIFCLLF